MTRIKIIVQGAFGRKVTINSRNRASQINFLLLQFRCILPAASFLTARNRFSFFLATNWMSVAAIYCSSRIFARMMRPRCRLHAETNLDSQDKYVVKLVSDAPLAYPVEFGYKRASVDRWTAET